MIFWKGAAPARQAGPMVICNGDLVFGGPHGAVAVSNLALDHGGSQGALATVVCGVNLFGEGAEDEPLVFRASDFDAPRNSFAVKSLRVI